MGKAPNPNFLEHEFIKRRSLIFTMFVYGER